jgi:ELWxxDGT repeat protein
MSAVTGRIAIALVIGGLIICGGVETASAAAGDPVVSQVADINPGPGSSDPGDFVPVGSSVIFPASDGTHGYQLWESNGGPLGSGTSMDLINPSGTSNPFGGVNAGGTLFFPADDGVHGTELWKKAPGTPAQLVMNINTNGGANGPDSSNPQSFTAIGGTAFFVANDGSHGKEIWKSDGTTTTRVSNFTAEGPPDFAEMGVVGDTLFFPAREGTDGLELYKTSPPYTSASLVDNLNPSTTDGSSPSDFAEVNGQLFFTAADSGNNFELWRSASPFTDAVLVREIVAGPGCSCPHEMTGVGSTVYFTASAGGPTEVWRSDPPYDSGATQQVTSISGFNGPEDLTAGDGALYFDDDPVDFGREIFKTTGVGSTRISDVNPGGGDSDASNLFFNDGKLYFQATEPTHGYEPYVYDGTAVSLLKDIDPGPNSSFAGNFGALGTTVFFGADDGVTGYEPWKVTPEAAPPGSGGGAAQPPGPTGKRAKALKKCKKKKSKKARKKCRKKAKKLPV